MQVLHEPSLMGIRIAARIFVGAGVGAVLVANAVVRPAGAETCAPVTTTVSASASAPVSMKSPVITGSTVLDTLVARARREDWAALPIGELATRAGMELRGTRYQAGTLELDPDHEVCAVNLEAFDCVTFVETSLAFARMWKAGGSSADDLAREVEAIRYRGGHRTDYTSRLHYTVDWFYDNQRKHVLEVVSGDLAGAEPLGRGVNFMSTHPGSYRQLTAHPELIPRMAEIEQGISERDTWYVPRDRVSAVEPQLKTGDVVAFTTAVGGLDCGHVGLAFRDPEGVLRLLHASTSGEGVKLDQELGRYVGATRKHTGIVVARPLEPSGPHSRD